MKTNKQTNKIDMKTWDRKQIYDFFSRISNPFYMTSFVIDVTKLKEFTKKYNCSFYYSLIYLCTKAMSCVENFLYVNKGKNVYLINERIPSFTDRKTGSELFHIVTLPLSKDILSYCKLAKQTSQQQDSFIDFSKEGSSLAYFSCMPTLQLTAVTNEFDIMSPNFASDSVPRISWGGYYKQQGKLKLNISLEVNHRFIDGIHIEKFNSYLQKMINDLD